MKMSTNDNVEKKKVTVTIRDSVTIFIKKIDEDLSEEQCDIISFQEALSVKLYIEKNSEDKIHK